MTTVNYQLERENIMKTIIEITNQLKKASLFHEFIFNQQYLTSLPKDLNQAKITHLSYNSLDPDLSAETLFIIKGTSFKKEYLEQAIKQGVNFYISEIDYEIPNTVAIIVDQVELAMATIARYFYDFPDQNIILIGVTGTKGKTTTSYFLRDILSHPDMPAGLINSQEIFTGKQTVESTLTTPESLDTYRYLKEMVDSGLKYCVLEASSQGYKKNRLYLLEFDYAIFLNFSPDHIGTGEHESMNDYFYCKRQLLHHAKHLILNNELEQIDFIIQDAKENNANLQEIFCFAEAPNEKVDYTFKSTDINHFTLFNQIENWQQEIELAILGHYNHENAMASLIVGDILGENINEMAAKIKQTTVSGRFEVFKKDNQIIIVDSAHNETSFRNVIQSARQYFGANRPISVLGNASGDKAENRRAGFARVFNETKPRKVYIAEDSPNFSTTAEIGQEIIDETKKLDATIPFDTTYQDDRPKQIYKALSEMEPNEIVFILGKGSETSQRICGKAEPYVGDRVVVETWLENN